MLLRAFIGLLESFGFKVVGAHEVVPDLLSPSPAQALTRTAPDARERHNLELAMEAALRLGISMSGRAQLQLADVS